MEDDVAFYFQYFVPGQGKEVKRSLPLGEYDETGRRGLTLSQARDRAASLARLYRDGVTDLHSHFERQREAEEGYAERKMRPRSRHRYLVRR